MHGNYSYPGPNKSVPHYIQQSIPTQNHYQHQPTVMQRQRRSWKNKAPVIVSPPNLTIPERPHSDKFLFPRDKHSPGYPIVFPRSKSTTGSRIHLCDIKVPPSSSCFAICQRDPLVTTSKTPLDVSSMSNHKKRSNYAPNSTAASCTVSQHDSSSPQYLKTDNQPHHKTCFLDHQQPQHRKKHHQQQDRRRSSMDPQPVPPRRFSHPENGGSQQIQHFPYHRHSHHYQQQRHHHQQPQQQPQQYYHLAPYVYPQVSGYSPHGMYAQPHQHQPYYQPYQGYSHHTDHHSKNSDSMPTDDDDDKQHRRVSTNTNTDSTTSSDLAPRRFSSGSTGSSGKSTLASSMGSVGIWHTDSFSSTASTKTTATTMTTPAISSAIVPAPTTKVDESAPLDDSSTMMHDSAPTNDDHNATLNTALDVTDESASHHSDLEMDGKGDTLLGANSQEEQTHYSSSSSSSVSSVLSAPLSPHHSATTPEPASPSNTTLPIWADPIKVRDNPTRYKAIQDYMDQHHIPSTSSLPLNKDIVFYFGDTKTTMANYRSSMQKLFTSSTVWDFSSCWRRYKELRKPSQMTTNQNLYCFQKGVEPMWEDEVNKYGGRLILCPGKYISLDDLFDWLLCTFVGGQMVAEGMVGLVLSRRARLDRIELWMDATSSKNPDTIVSVKNKLLKLLPENLREPVVSSHYKKHYDQ